MAAVIPTILSFLQGPVLAKVLDFIPDPNKKAEIQLELAKLASSDEAKQIDLLILQGQQQTGLDLADAQSGDKFRSYWRPTAAWICVAGMFFQFVFAPTASWIAGIFGKPLTLPPYDVGVLVTMLLSMLGLGTMRSYDKAKGTA